MPVSWSALRLIVTLSVLCVVATGTAQGQGCKETPAESIADSIKAALIFPAGVNFKIEDSEDTLTVSTYAHPVANASDMKIDTLLVCREVLKHKSDRFRKVVVLFFSYENQNLYAQVSANLCDVKNWERLRLSKPDLLRSISLSWLQLPTPFSRFADSSYDEIASITEPLQGLLYQERKHLAAQIAKARGSGVDVASVVTAYLLIEDAVRANDVAGARAAYAYTLSLYDNIVSQKAKVTSKQVTGKLAASGL